MKPISLSGLRSDIHTALKEWHKPNLDESPLNYLYLFRQALNEVPYARHATNKVILDALETLAVDHGRSASILRSRFLDQKMVQTVARETNLAESTVFALQREAITDLTSTLYTLEKQARRTAESSLEERLNLPPFNELIGVERQLQVLLDLAISARPPWLVSVEGLGGIGKTALANALVRELVLISRFEDIAWVSAKQQEFAAIFGHQKTDTPALDQENLVNSLLEQLNKETSLSVSLREKMSTLTKLLKSAPYFIVIDNLETMIDYESLLPTLRKLANPSRFLLTSRYSLQTYTDVFCLGLRELSQADTFMFIKQDARERGIPALAKASQTQLDSIYQIVGGNPLALKLVVGQITLLPLSQVLDSLKAVRGKAINELYTYIYWQAWHLLDPVSQQAFLRMPLVHEGTLEQLTVLSELEPAELLQALQQLVSLSLVQVEGDLEDRRYTLHRLTETFLLNEAIKWHPSS